MKRILLAIPLFLVVPALGWGARVDVYLKDGKEYLGATLIKEDPGGMKLKHRGKDVEVQPDKIEQVTYDTTKVSKLDFRAPFTTLRNANRARGEKRKELLQKALEEFQALDRQVQTESPEGHRYLQYMIARVQGIQAREDPTKMDAAIKALQEFTRGFPNGWELVPALKMLAQLMESKKDFDGARRAYEELTRIPGVPEEVKQRSDLLVGQLLIRARRYTEAEVKLTGLLSKLPAKDPRRATVEVFLARSEMKRGALSKVEDRIRQALAVTTDDNVRANAHNFLGDYYQKKGDLESAFWEYLKVDMLYSQDVEEHAKALYHLRILFDKVRNDPIRAKQYANKLLDKRFQTTAYHKLVAKEQPPEPKKN